MQTENNPHELPQAEKEDFWLELGPPSAYTGLECEDTARENGDASPDAKRLGWPGAEPGQSLATLPENAPPALDDVPPVDR